jgi:hypothetical protein
VYSDLALSSNIYKKMKGKVDEPFDVDVIDRHNKLGLFKLIKCCTLSIRGLLIVKLILINNQEKERKKRAKPPDHPLVE